ncbi:Transmembrane protein 19 [Porphyridium purpureum]|uniref:Transmembrane protein 19 n=1 Tax=Porphyridium purpureum TaxID=35688 RepID=A0A5J4YY88_PORPP|nr:Transmembrane protein 19 [Porphyridium purpureum]|eukprot:POR1600..scf209_3
MSAYAHDIVRALLAVVIASVAAYKGHRRGSLTHDGAIAAFIVGATSLSCSWRFGLTLLLFYFSGTRLTKWRQEEKRRLDRSDIADSAGDSNGTSTQAPHGRNSSQVLATTIPAVLAAVMFRSVCGTDCSFGCVARASSLDICRSLIVFYLCFFAGSAGDTWASEIGTANRFEWDTPRLVLPPFRRVPRGTNGGITIVGTIASALGGAFIGLVFYLSNLHCLLSDGIACLDGASVGDLLRHMSLGTIAGFLGSLTDSLLGAVFQASDYDLDAKCVVRVKAGGRYPASVTRISGVDVLSNEAVNLISVTLVSTLLALSVKL